MAKLWLPTILVTLLTLAACTNPAPTMVVEPTQRATLTEPATAADSQTDRTPAGKQTEEPTNLPMQASPNQNEPTATVAPTPISEPEPTTTNGPAPTLDPTPVPAPSETPTPTAGSTPTTLATPIPTSSQSSSLWRGITIASEDRCSEYDPDDYRYSPSVEPRIVDAQGGIYGPYTGTWFQSIRDTDIEHIVARSEAHDSGLCAATPETRSEFASDLLNLTLASPSVNRHQKTDHDAAEWLPDLNRCWYVDRIVQIRLEYRLTIDRTEAEAIDAVLTTCDSTEMVVLPPETRDTSPPTPTPSPLPRTTSDPNTDIDALAMWDDNGNGRITCAEARAHGIAPVHRGHPAYEYMRDADEDGVVCE